MLQESQLIKNAGKSGIQRNTRNVSNYKNKKKSSYRSGTISNTMANENFLSRLKNPNLENEDSKNKAALLPQNTGQELATDRIAQENLEIKNNIQYQLGIILYI